MNVLPITAALVLALAQATSPVLAQAPSAAAARAASGPAAASMATGLVLEVDSKEQRVLVEHGPIASIGMDAMTMEFLVPDRTLLGQLKPGDRIRFAVVWRNGEYEITKAKVTARKAAAR